MQTTAVHKVHRKYVPDLAAGVLQDAGFLPYYHLTGEQPVDLTTIRERLIPGTTQVLQPPASPYLAPYFEMPCFGNDYRTVYCIPRIPAVGEIFGSRF